MMEKCERLLDRVLKKEIGLRELRRLRSQYAYYKNPDGLSQIEFDWIVAMRSLALGRRRATIQAFTHREMNHIRIIEHCVMRFLDERRWKECDEIHRVIKKRLPSLPEEKRLALSSHVLNRLCELDLSEYKLRLNPSCFLYRRNPSKSITLKSRWSEIATSPDRWTQWLEVCETEDPELYDWWSDSSECRPCAHSDESGKWCNLVDLPANYNPVSNGYGMACCGLGYHVPGEQREINLDNDLPF